MVIIIPFFLGVFYSLTDWNGVDMKINFVGFKNYMTIFHPIPLSIRFSSQLNLP